MIYKITNTLNNKTYIGGTVKTNPQKRLNEHISHAKKYMSKIEKMVDMRNIDKKYWRIEKIEDCPNDKIKERETYYIRKYYDEGYNLYNDNEISNVSTIFYSFDLKTREIKKYYNLKDTGYNISKVSCVLNKIKEKVNGKEYTRKSYKNKLWSYNNNKEEWEQLNTEFNNKKTKPRKIRNIDTGIVYETISDANEDLGKPRRHNSINNALKGRTKMGLGYHWEYLD